MLWPHVPADLKTFDAKRMKEEIEVDNFRFRQRGLTPPTDTKGLEESGGLADPSAPKSKAKTVPKKNRGPKAGLGAPTG